MIGQIRFLILKNLTKKVQVILSEDMLKPTIITRALKILTRKPIKFQPEVVAMCILGISRTLMYYLH